MGSVGPEWWLLSDPEAYCSPLPLRTSISKVTSWPIMAAGVVVRARGEELTLSLRSISEVPFKTSFARTWSHGPPRLHCPLSAGRQCAQSKKGSVTEEQEEKTVGAAPSGRRRPVRPPPWSSRCCRSNGEVFLSTGTFSACQCLFLKSSLNL